MNVLCNTPVGLHIGPSGEPKGIVAALPWLWDGDQAAWSCVDGEGMLNIARVKFARGSGGNWSLTAIP